MYWNPYQRPGYKIPVRRAPIGGASPYVSRHSVPVTTEADQTPQPAPPVEQKQAPPAPAAVEEKPATEAVETTDWQDIAQRLQAEMENFRKRQIRRADEAITAERERLLRLMLSVADNLSRALRYDNSNEQSLREGVELIQHELLRKLQSEGVTRIETIGQPFSPELHEAVATRPNPAEPGTIIEEIEAGYKLGDKLLRPARVVVAA